MAASLLAGCAASSAGKKPSLASPAVAAPALEIVRVGVEPKTLDLRAGGAETVRYDLTRAAEVRLEIVDEEGRVARRVEAGLQPAGSQKLVWDGLTSRGDKASEGVYRYVLRAQDAAGGQAVYDPSTESGGDELVPRDFTFDPGAGAFRWVMPRVGRARLRVGLEGFPHLRTLMDWQPLEAGEQTLVWDGWDASGRIRLKDHPRLSIKLSVFSLPDNAIIVRGGPPPAPAAGAEAPAYLPDRGEHKSYFHAKHEGAVCHEVRLRVEFPQVERRDSVGSPVLAGVVPVRVSLDARDAPRLIDRRFEVALYEDTTFLFEEEESSNPFTYLWDTTRLPPGEHLFTVNVFSYDDHYGVATERVVIGGAVS